MKLDILIAVAEKGGVENVINTTFPYLQTKGWQIRVIQLVWEGVHWTAEGLPFFPLLWGREGHCLGEFAQEYAGFLQKNGTPQAILATAWPAMCYVAKKANYIKSSENSIPVISYLHEPVSRYQEAGFGGYENLCLADGHLAISQKLYQDISQNCVTNCVRLVRNPINTSMYRLIKRKTRKGRKKLLFIGRIDEQKRLDVIIRSLSEVKDSWVLHVIGDGEEAYKNELFQIAKDYGISDHIRWYGWKSNPWSYSNDTDAFVMASDYEGFPLTAIEAQAHGLPVISTPCEGVSELINPGINGFLYPFGDWKALAEILKAISSGILPIITPEACQNAALPFRAEYALPDFECKLKELCGYMD